MTELIDLPDGWTCIECGDEYLEDTEGKLVDDYTEGTLCKKCNKQSDENDSLIQEDLRENIQNELADMTVNDFTNLIDKYDLGIAELDAMFYDLLEILVKERSK